MSDFLADERLVWFLIRGTGVVAMVLLSASVLLGVASTARTRITWWPQFATQALHRSLAVMSVTLLAGHVATAVLHSYVDIGWQATVLPFAVGYERLWIGLGTCAVDLLLAVVLTSLARARLPLRAWGAVHVTTYLAWAAAMAHGLGIGTDATTTWGLATSLCCVAAVAAAAGARIAALPAERARRRGPVPTPSLAGGLAAGLDAR